MIFNKQIIDFSDSSDGELSEDDGHLSDIRQPIDNRPLVPERLSSDGILQSHELAKPSGLFDHYGVTFLRLKLVDRYVYCSVASMPIKLRNCFL